MSNERFDELARLVGQRVTRRTVIKGVLATAFAGVFGRFAAPAAAQACIPEGNTCNPTQGTDPEDQCCPDAVCRIAPPPGNPRGRLAWRCVGCGELGTTCTTNLDCCDGQGAVCVPTAEGGRVCALPQGVGGLCDTEADCANGLRCIPTDDGTRVCDEPQAPGGYCDTANDCANGVSCVANPTTPDGRPRICCSTRLCVHGDGAVECCADPSSTCENDGLGGTQCSDPVHGGGPGTPCFDETNCNDITVCVPNPDGSRTCEIPVECGFCDDDTDCLAGTTCVPNPAGGPNVCTNNVVCPLLDGTPICCVAGEVCAPGPLPTDEHVCAVPVECGFCDDATDCPPETTCVPGAPGGSNVCTNNTVCVDSLGAPICCASTTAVCCDSGTGGVTVCCESGDCIGPNAENQFYCLAADFGAICAADPECTTTCDEALDTCRACPLLHEDCYSGLAVTDCCEVLDGEVCVTTTGTCCPLGTTVTCTTATGVVQCCDPSTTPVCVPEGGTGPGEVCSCVAEAQPCTLDTQCCSGTCDTNAGICAILVTQDTLAATGWSLTASDATASATLVVGPGTPPLGNMGSGGAADGSVQLAIGMDGNQDAQARNNAYNGALLSDVSAMSYWTYVQQTGTGGQAPYLILDIDTDGDGNRDDLWFFEPVYQDATFCPSNDQGGVVDGVWQSWDAYNGCWYSVFGTAGSGPGIAVTSFATLLTALPNARLNAPASGLGSLRIVAGFGAVAWDNFVGNADGFLITIAGETDDYDFEDA